MRKIAIAGFAAALLAAAATVPAQDAPKPPGPEKGHEWLQRFVGEWSFEGEAYMEPGKPPVKFSGTETARSVGGLWIVAESKSTFFDMPYSTLLTVGYDPQKKKYVGTWIDSFSSHLWKYEGEVQGDGKTLALETEGPCPLAPGTLALFKEVTEFKSKDHKQFTATMKGPDGKWVTMMKIDFRRKR